MGELLDSGDFMDRLQAVERFITKFKEVYNKEECEGAIAALRSEVATMKEDIEGQHDYLRELRQRYALAQHALMKEEEDSPRIAVTVPPVAIHYGIIVALTLGPWVGALAWAGLR